MNSTQRNNIVNPKDGLIVYDSTTYSFWFFRNIGWQEFHWEAGESGAFENNAGVVRNTGANIDDFFFGHEELPQNRDALTQNLFFFDENKAAIRGGVLFNLNISKPKNN
jgi:hypothetical protein